jgi:mRNA interferase MazF
MPYNRGDVVLVLFPDSNLATAKRRPAIVVQSNQLNTGLAQTIVAMITSNLSRAGHPSRVVVAQSSSEGRRMGLLSDSVVMTDNLATVLNSEIDRGIGKCDDMRTVDAALRHTLGLGSG